MSCRHDWYDDYKAYTRMNAGRTNRGGGDDWGCLLMLLSGCQKNLDTYDYDWENELVIIGNPIPSLIAAIEAHDQGMDDILVVVPFLKDQF